MGSFAIHSTLVSWAASRIAGGRRGFARVALRPMPMHYMALCVAGLSISHCSFQPGEPWAEIDAGVSARFVPEMHAGRIDALGRLVTANGYALSFDTFALELGALVLLHSGPSAVTDFDPSSPPPGYSLCHNGHCHSDAGELVDYEEIQLELDQGGAGARPIIYPITDAALDVRAAATSYTLEECPAQTGCILDRGRISAVGLRVVGLRIRARVEDVTGARLGPDGVAFVADLELDTQLLRSVKLDIDADTAPGIGLDASFEFPVAGFDAVQWAGLPGFADAQARRSGEEEWLDELSGLISAALEEHVEAIHVDVRRY